MYGQTFNHPATLNDEYYKRKIRWLMILRVIILTILLGSISIIQIKRVSSSLNPFYVLIAVTYLLTILYAVLFHYLNNNMIVLAYIQLVADVLIEACLIYFTGGIESTFSFMFIITIITASIVLFRRGSLVIASMSSILYGLLLDLQYYGLFSFPSNYPVTPNHLNTSYVFYTMFVNICAFYLIAFLCGYLAESTKKKDQELSASHEDLMELKAFNEDILKNIRSGLVVTDLKGKVTLANKAAMEILSIHDLNSKSPFWHDLFLPIDFQATVKFLENDADQTLTCNEFINCGSRGPCFIGLNLSTIQDAQSKTKGTITSFQDLTEFKRMEDQLKQADILATIGGMSAGIAHELRNPMASIKGSIQLLAEGLTLDPEQKALMNIVINESIHLNNIINDFLTYAKPRPPQLESCNISSLVHDTLTILKNGEMFKKDIAVYIDLEPENTSISLDIDQMKQVFWNLAINACQAMPDGGILSVKSSTKKIKEKSYKIIEFQDTGVGISKEHINRIFHPFYTTKEKGTGLGLCTAYRIIEEHGGRIEIESEPGRGSLFRIYISLNSNPRA
jgi:two-component system sensor histidine kinase PilS (NtrC family)